MRRRATIGTLLVVLFTPAAARAYTLRTTDAGRPVHWSDTTVSFRVDRSVGDVASPDEVARTVAQALAVWGGLPTSTFFFDGDLRPVSAHEPSSWDGISDIVLIADDWPFDHDYAGVTLVAYDTATGAIKDADVFLNAVDQDFDIEAAGDAYDVGNVLTHELGHLLGMGHSDDADATMFAMSRPGETEKRTLSADDAAGFEVLYGSTGPAAAPSCSTTPQGPGSSAVFLSVVMLTLGIASRIHRRHGVRRQRLALAVGAGLIALVGGAGAGQAFEGRYQAPDELARRADVVFRGTVLERQAHWAGRFIVTDVTVSVDECWAGRCGTRTRVVRELGGEVGGIGMLPPEPTALRVGVEVVLFVREARGTDQLVLVGGAQGVFTLDPRTHRVHRDVTALPDRPLPAPVENLDLRSLRAAVRTGLEAQRGSR